VQWDSKKEVLLSCFRLKFWTIHFLFNLSNFLVGSGGNLKRMLQKLHEENLAPHKDRLEKKYYEIVQEGSLEGKKY
jgi:hypothetical protein